MAITPDAEEERTALDLLLRGFQVSRMLRLVADLGVADRIPPDGDVALHDLARDCGVRHQPLMRVLRALAAFGVFVVRADGTVAHSVRSRLLRTDTPKSLHHAARFWTAPGSWRAWERLDAALAGEVPHEAAWSIGRFDHLRAHAEEGRIYDAMMANYPDNRHAAIAEAYDFSNVRLIADIGGGNGALLRQILTRLPDARGLVFDRTDVIQAIPPDGLMSGRIAVAEGSFFEGVPAGADVYTLVRVLHDWSDEDCATILHACRAAMKPEAVLLIGEQILDPDPASGQTVGYLSDMHMMAMFGSARERTEDDFRALLAEAGLTLRRVISIRSTVSVIEAALD
jgi:hypothetical protein